MGLARLLVDLTVGGEGSSAAVDRFLQENDYLRQTAEDAYAFKSENQLLKFQIATRKRIAAATKGANQSVGEPSNRGRSRGRRSQSRLLGKLDSVYCGRSSDGCRVPVEPQAPSKPSRKLWVEAAKQGGMDYSLSYVPLVLVAGKVRVRPGENTLANASLIWKGCLVRYFVGKCLPFKLTESIARRVWGPALHSVMANEQGFYFFHILDADIRRRILDGGPRVFAKVPFILQQWHALLKLEIGRHDVLPLWIRLKKIPLSLWSASGFSELASAVGKPLHVDLQTERMHRISFARVYVEVDARKPLITKFDLELGDELQEIQVEPEWKPAICPKCSVFGHRCPIVAPAPTKEPCGL